MTATATDRFKAKVAEDPETGCLIWTASTRSGGYGQFWDGRVWTAHIWAYEHAVGPVPDGLDLDHLCRTRACVNPAHLEPVTRRENLARGDHPYRGRGSCTRGHAFDEANTYHYKGARLCRARRSDRRRA